MLRLIEVFVANTEFGILNLERKHHIGLRFDVDGNGISAQDISVVIVSP